MDAATMPVFSGFSNDMSAAPRDRKIMLAAVTRINHQTGLPRAWKIKPGHWSGKSDISPILGDWVWPTQIRAGDVQPTHWRELQDGEEG